MTGTVKWFSGTKGFGFITPADGGPDVFVHKSGIRDAGNIRLRDGDRVKYDVIEGERGTKAINVQVID